MSGRDMKMNRIFYQKLLTILMIISSGKVRSGNGDALIKSSMAQVAGRLM
jgi:hypothetical protein